MFLSQKQIRSRKLVRYNKLLKGRTLIAKGKKKPDYLIETKETKKKNLSKNRGGGEMRSYCLMGIGCIGCDEDKVLGMDSGDGCATL